MSKKLRLHQFLSKTGVFKSKEDIFAAIEDGDIFVNNKMTRNKDFQFKISSSVTYKDQVLKTIEEDTYIILNKPQGYLCSRLSKTDKELNKKSVYDLINVNSNLKNSLSCVGRLDENSQGLLIMTNDGKLNIAVTNPKKAIKKVYGVKLEKELSIEDKEKLEQGIDIKLEENGVESIYRTKPCKIKILKNNQAEITITEGKKRQVRRMFESVNNKVLILKRTQINDLILDVKEGKYKTMSKDMIMRKLGL